MFMNEIRTWSLVKLVDNLNKLERGTDQIKINAIAYELAYRIYVPNVLKMTFEELLERLGYEEVRMK